MGTKEAANRGGVAKRGLPNNGMHAPSSLSAGDCFSSAEPSDKTNNENA